MFPRCSPLWPLPAFLAFILCLQPAHGWDAKGHRAVAAIAWDQMKAPTRTKVIQLLRAAPADSDLLAEDATSTLPQDQRDRELFLHASTWPDIVRDKDKPARRDKYHKPVWHYVNIFWQQNAAGVGAERTDMAPKGEIIEQLEKQAALLSNAQATPEDRAISICWFEHLAGDLHQPMHANARVTDLEPQGDRGGNDFCLGSTHPAGFHPCESTLHGLWDSILTSNRAADSLKTICDDLEKRFPKPADLRLKEYKLWARESLQISMTVVYPFTLQRHMKPAPEYFAEALKQSEPRIALAGYRLGEALNALLP